MSTTIKEAMAQNAGLRLELQKKLDGWEAIEDGYDEKIEALQLKRGWLETEIDDINFEIETLHDRVRKQKTRYKPLTPEQQVKTENRLKELQEEYDRMEGYIDSLQPA